MSTCRSFQLLLLLTRARLRFRFKMFSYIIIKDGPLVQILQDKNVVDECGPWDSLTSAIHWAESYVAFKNSGKDEPNIV